MCRFLYHEIFVIVLLFLLLLIPACVNQTASSSSSKEPYLIYPAVESGNIGEVQRLLDRGFDINYTIGITPLNRAVCRNDIKMVKFLISKGARVDDIGYAVELGNIEMVKLLLDHSAKIAGFSVAVQKANMPMIKLLLERGADINEVVPNNRGGTALHSAVTVNANIVDLLISRGANVNAVDEDGETPLHRLAKFYPQDNQPSDDSKRVINSLLAAGAEIDAKSHYGLTPLACAAEHAGMNRPNGAITILVERGAKLSNVKDECFGLIVASYIMSPEELAVWFKNNITNVNAVDRYHSPLICSVSRGSAPSAVELLIRADANVNAVDGEDRNTSLHCAVLSGRIEIAEVLIKGGADLNKQNRWGYTPLHMSPLPTIGDEARGKDFDTKMLELLIRSGARMDIPDKYGGTVLDKYIHWIPQTAKGRKYQKTVVDLLKKK